MIGHGALLTAASTMGWFIFRRFIFTQGLKKTVTWNLRNNYSSIKNVNWVIEYDFYIYQITMLHGKWSFIFLYLKIMQNHIIAKLGNYDKLHIMGKKSVKLQGGKICQITLGKKFVKLHTGKNLSNYRRYSIKNKIN